MLGVGIHENVVLTSKTTINEKGSIVIGMATKGNMADVMAAMESGNNLSTEECNLIVFPPKATDWEGKSLTWKQSADWLTGFRNNLIDILSVFMPLEQAKTTLSLQVQIAGLNISAANIESKFLEETVLVACYSNICKAFIAASAPFIDKGAFRVKLARTSRKSHFASIPKRGNIPEVWIESMQIPKEASKIAWSAYDIKQGYNDGTPQATDTTNTAQAEAAFAPPAFSAPSAPAFTTQAPIPSAADPNAPIAPAINVFNPALPTG